MDKKTYDNSSHEAQKENDRMGVAGILHFVANSIEEGKVVPDAFSLEDDILTMKYTVIQPKG